MIEENWQLFENQYANFSLNQVKNELPIYYNQNFSPSVVIIIIMSCC